MKRLLFLCVLLLSPYLVADSLTVTGTQSVTATSNPHMAFSTDYKGVPIDGDMDFSATGASTNFALAFVIPENAIIYNASLTLSRYSFASMLLTANSTPLPQEGEFGCDQSPCAYSPAFGYGDIQTTGMEVYATLGDEVHTVFLPMGNYLDLEHTVSEGSVTDEANAQDTLTFDLLALGWSDALHGSQILQITGSNNMNAIADYGTFGVGVVTQVNLFAIRNDDLSASLNIRYFIPVPEPATVSLVFVGIVVGVRRLRESRGRV